MIQDDIPELIEEKKGSIYLLLGYLGSGKTTFIKELLNNKHGAQYAIIQNQFTQSEMGIEQPMIVNESGTPFSNFLELPNGCICCSAKNDLMAGIEYILSNTDVKNIVVETNGLADPAQSIKQFWFDSEMKIGAELHSVISIINCQKYFERKDSELLNRQVVFANKILLTFLDKVSEEKAKKVVEDLKMKNQDAIIEKNVKYDIKTFVQEGELFSILQNGNNFTKYQKNQTFHQNVQSIFLKGKFSKEITKHELQRRLGLLLWQGQSKILRVKGVACLQDSKFVFQIQGVEETFEIRQSHTERETYKNQSKILFIGRQIKSQLIKEVLQII